MKQRLRSNLISYLLIVSLVSHVEPVVIKPLYIVEYAKILKLGEPVDMEYSFTMNKETNEYISTRLSISYKNGYEVYRSYNFEPDKIITVNSEGFDKFRRYINQYFVLEKRVFIK